ncbi:MAG: site-specific integrase [Bryobacteraceae bacterium]|nr:site-specific integrase [Bryobacteraceae bacterium]
MAIVLYRRHTAKCAVHKLKLPAKAKRRYMGCECPIWVYGRTDNELVPRQSTGTTDLKTAEAIKASLIAEGKDKAVYGPTISECVEKYLASRQHERSENTQAQDATILARFRKYSETRGVFHIQDVTVDMIETYKVEGLVGLADTTKATSLKQLRCFLRHAYRRDWITVPIVEKLAPFRVVYDQKDPFSDADVEKLLAGALKITNGTVVSKSPATFQLLMRLMLETGMRISDAIMFRPAALERGEMLWIYPHHQKKHKRTAQPKVVESFISDDLKQAIDECCWLSREFPFRPAGWGVRSVAVNVGKIMQAIGKSEGIHDCRPHRLRDTFAVRALLNGMALEDVSRLLGHSSVQMTERYYAKWTLGRKRRLERLVAETLMSWVETAEVPAAGVSSDAG